MNLLSRIQHVLGTRGRPERDSAWLAGVVGPAIPLTVAVVVGASVGSHAAMAQEGARSRASDAESTAAEDGRRRSAETDANVRSAETEADTRSAEGDGARRSEEGDGTRLVESFEPQTEREAALYEMILQLQREISELREGRPAREGAVRDGDGRERTGPRDGEAVSDLNREQRRQVRTFQSYDRDGNGEMTLAEFQGLFEGSADRSQMFGAADRDEDGTLSQDEFVEFRLQPRPRTEGGDAPREGDPRRGADGDPVQR